MPELPEVETLRLTLLPYLPTPRIETVEILHPSVISPLTEEFFLKSVLGKQMIGAQRRGKYLVLLLSPIGKLVVHLRMTGQLFHRSQEESADSRIPHTHLVFTFEGGSAFHYADVRRFGRVRYYEDEITDSGYCSLGPEPFDPAFTCAYLEGFCHRRKAPIKSLLLDQKTVAGLGNIYADEALFRAGIYPRRPANLLSKQDWYNLQKSITTVLAEAVDARGSSLRDYLDANREKGDFQNQWQVYQKTDTPCPRCGAAIERIRVAGRSSHYCPRCQPLEGNSSERIIGITGGIASGKSTVVSYLKAKGAHVIDADEISRALTAENGRGIPLIAKEFGDDYLLSPGILDRKKLGELIFNNEAARNRLNQRLHPIIIAEIQRRTHTYWKEGSKYPLFLDIPLLFEVGLAYLCDDIWLVWVDEATQKKRLMKRDQITLEQAQKRITSQLPFSEKIPQSTHVIDNSKSIKKTEAQVELLWDLYQFPNNKKE